MSIFNLVMTAQERELRRKIDENLAKFKEEQAEFEAEMFKNISKEHLMATGQAPDDELVGKMANELAEAIKNRTFEWKRPLPEVIHLGDKEQMDEMQESFELYMHDVLEQLGYGTYKPGQ